MPASTNPQEYSQWNQGYPTDTLAPTWQGASNTGYSSTYAPNAPAYPSTGVNTASTPPLVPGTVQSYAYPTTASSTSGAPSAYSSASHTAAAQTGYPTPASTSSNAPGLSSHSQAAYEPTAAAGVPTPAYVPPEKAKSPRSKLPYSPAQPMLLPSSLRTYEGPLIPGSTPSSTTATPATSATAYNTPVVMAHTGAPVTTAPTTNFPTPTPAYTSATPAAAPLPNVATQTATPPVPTFNVAAQGGLYSASGTKPRTTNAPKYVPVVDGFITTAGDHERGAKYGNPTGSHRFIHGQGVTPTHLHENVVTGGPPAVPVPPVYGAPSAVASTTAAAPATVVPGVPSVPGIPAPPASYATSATTVPMHQQQQTYAPAPQGTNVYAPAASIPSPPTATSAASPPGSTMPYSQVSNLPPQTPATVAPHTYITSAPPASVPAIPSVPAVPGVPVAPAPTVYTGAPQPATHQVMAPMSGIPPVPTPIMPQSMPPQSNVFSPQPVSVPPRY